jgi:hypothetical protein
MSGTLRRVRMPVAGMASGQCGPRVREALERVGARQVNVVWQRGEVWFGLPRAVDRAALRAAVSAAGYAPGEIERPLPT